ncbi:MAG TPA: DUF4167 domain-containing protein [Allosphingosinicella sp.]|nr:DUF4167 domain-containing protein [Allosphingosinicella sp.]
MINNRQNGRRRGRGGGPRSPNVPNAGNRQDNRQRGNAAQLHEKYKALARDAQLSGDRVQTEYYLQFADHYFRVLNEGRARFEEQRRQRDDYGQDGNDDQDEAAMAADGDDQGDQGDDGDRDYRNGSDRHRPRFAAREIEQRAEDPPEPANEERISLDVLPPAIASDGAGEQERAPRRRQRRPRPESDTDIAPAA